MKLGFEYASTRNGATPRRFEAKICLLSKQIQIKLNARKTTFFICRFVNSVLPQVTAKSLQRNFDNIFDRDKTNERQPELESRLKSELKSGRQTNRHTASMTLKKILQPVRKFSNTLNSTLAPDTQHTKTRTAVLFCIRLSISRKRRCCLWYAKLKRGCRLSSSVNSSGACC